MFIRKIPCLNYFADAAKSMATFKRYVVIGSMKIPYHESLEDFIHALDVPMMNKYIPFPTNGLMTLTDIDIMRQNMVMGRYVIIKNADDTLKAIYVPLGLLDAIKKANKKHIIIDNPIHISMKDDRALEIDSIDAFNSLGNHTV